MHGGLGVNIVKNDYVVILPNNFRRDLSCDDFFKNGHDTSELGVSHGIAVNLRNLTLIQIRKLDLRRACPENFQRTEQSNRAKSGAAASLSRMHHTISSRTPSQAGIPALTPRKRVQQGLSDHIRTLSITASTTDM